MLRLIAVLALACGLAGCFSSPFSQVPVSQVAPASQVVPPISQNPTPPGAAGSKFDCVTDEGYGRTMPCGYAVQ